jgi:type VI secretion system secreted protein VgrG
MNSPSPSFARPEIVLPLSVPFRVERLTGTERVSGLFGMEVEIEPINPGTFDPAQVTMEEVLGKQASIRMVRGGSPGGELLRTWHGIIQKLTIVPVEEARRPYIYRLCLAPWLALWNLATSCRMLEDVKVTDVIQALLGDWQQSHLCEQRLSGSFETCRYRCQFQETDFNFLTRILEEEGIFYYFQHGSDGHQLILVDRLTLAGESPPLVMDLGRDVTHWQADYQLHSGTHAVRDYDEYSAEVRHARESTIHPASNQPRWERQEYPGRVTSSSEAAQRARTGMEREETRQATFRGVSSEPRIGAGDKISLRAQENPALKSEYFLTSVQHAYDSQHGYRNSITAVQSGEDATYRPPRSAAKPVIMGPQTAIVTNEPPGEELPGMVRVRFPWDKTESNSCRIRVAEMMAGDGWGTWFPPRVEHEVLVEFLNGDPDRPVVTGRLYHGRHHPAEDNALITAIRTEQGQELRFDDHLGSEEVVLRGSRHVQILAGPGTLTIKDEAGNEIKLSPTGGIEVRSAATIKIDAAMFELTAGMVTVNAGLMRASGVIQCSTLITNAVVSASYTPGAGNIW